MMKKLINFFKKLFRCDASCLKCKNEPCKCELEVPAEHIRTVEPVSHVEFAQETTVEFPTTVKVEAVSTSKEEIKAEEKPAPKKKRAPRKKKSETTKK